MVARSKMFNYQGIYRAFIMITTWSLVLRHIVVKVTSMITILGSSAGAKDKEKILSHGHLKENNSASPTMVTNHFCESSFQNFQSPVLAVMGDVFDELCFVGIDKRILAKNTIKAPYLSVQWSSNFSTNDPIHFLFVQLFNESNKSPGSDMFSLTKSHLRLFKVQVRYDPHEYFLSKKQRSLTRIATHLVVSCGVGLLRLIDVLR
eukprot:gene2301-4475_t